jgi:HSP20 family molecular chaperone IbpA
MTSRASHDEVLAATAETAATMPPQKVPVNAYETPGAFVILAPLPAVTAGDVTVELTDGSIRFWAELRAAGTRTYLIHEWEYGGYERTVDVPDGYGAGVEASLANGQLAIRVLSGEFTEPIKVNPAP